MESTQAFYEQKEFHGRWATIVWLASGVYLFATKAEASFLSWQALLFFLVGMFAAALVFGMLSYGIQRGVVRLILANAPRLADHPTLLALSGSALLGVEALVLFVVARFIVDHVLYR